MGKGPLAGIRLIEMDAIGPVPLTGMILGGLGADVLRIARSPSGAWRDAGGAVLDRGKRQLALDLKQPADRDCLLDLIAHADALIEGARPGVMERLGLGPDDCLARNPRLVFARVTGWGQEGPLAHSAGHDLNYIAMTGALHAIGRAGAPPVVPLNLIGDYAGGTMFAVLGVVAAILSARVTGKGQAVDVAMVDGVANLMAMFHAFLATGAWTDVPEANLLDGGRPFYRCYACKDGKYISVGALESQFFAVLVEKLGFAPDRFVQHDSTAWPAMEVVFAAAFAARTRDEWAALFLGTDACVAPVLSMVEAMAHPANTARGVFVDRVGVVQAVPAPRFSATPGAIGKSATITIDQAIAAWS
jgi:alpha-methylacyl-CoA racemase